MKKPVLIALFVIVIVAIYFIFINKPKTDTPPPDDNKNEVPLISYSIVDSFPHDTSSYTQGLVVYNGELYEGTGLVNKSKLMKIDLKTGKALQPQIKLDSIYFGEGITIINDTLYQLTWQNKVVFMYSLKDFRKLKELPIATEGWGITTDGRELIVSDGSSNLNFYEPGSFKQLRTVSISEAGELVNNVNELEYIDGFVYGNKYLTDIILKINPVTGIVEGKIDLSDMAIRLRSKFPFAEVLNGIAYEKDTKKVYVTGKLWPELYEIRIGN